MKFNTTKAESSQFLRKVLEIQGKYTKGELMGKFIEKVGDDVVIIDKDKIANAYKELAVLILEQHATVEEFLSKNNFERVKVMHFYLVEKVILRVLRARQYRNKSFDYDSLLNMIITHLLNQSRNFYQIESRFLKDHLLKYVSFAQEEAARRKEDQGGWEVPEDKQNLKSGEEEEEYEYDEEEDQEEAKEIAADKKEMEDKFNNALIQLKSNEPAMQDTERDFVLRINTKEN